MTERTQLTNFLLLSILAGILLLSGSLQCAFDCLTRNDGPISNHALHSVGLRVDICHLSVDQHPAATACLNKACHQRLPYQRNLGGPEIFRLVNLAQPLHNTWRQPAPLFRAGSTFEISPHPQQNQQRQPQAADYVLTQTLSSIRTTVLIC